MTRMRPDRVRGPLHDEFWDWCDRGELRLPRCDACSHLQWPPATACDKCEGSSFTFAKMSGHGRIASWATFVHDYYKGSLDIPYDTILVALDEGPLFMSNPSGFGGDDIAIDQPVRLVFEDAEDSGGAYKLPLFARV